jgi:hypothetical protein
VAYPVQFLLAMMQPEVLVEAQKHDPQLTLLCPPWPVQCCLFHTSLERTALVLSAA